MPVRVTRLILLLMILPAATACVTQTSIERPSPFPGARLAPETTRARTPGPEARVVLTTALNLRGTTYRLGGDDPGDGFDCSGLVRYVYLQHEIVLPRTVAEQARVGRSIKWDKIQAGDLVFFTTSTPGPSHVGIAVDRETFVHAPGSGGVVRVERLDARYWRSRYVGARRLSQLGG